MTEGWCILRMSGRDTMRLAESLAKDGYDVWTPIETRKVSVPRANIKRDVRQPIMPSYVFARVGHLIDLIQLSKLPVRPLLHPGDDDEVRVHAGFSVMHFRDKIPVVADQHLAGLRRIEAKRTPIKKALYAFPRNASARVTSGICGGLVGVVVHSTPAKTKISFEKGLTFEIPTSLLDANELQGNQIAVLKAA